MPQPDLKGWSTAYEFLDGLTASPLYSILIQSDEDRYLAWVLACTVPFSRTPNPDSSVPPHKQSAPAVVAAREGIKAPNKVLTVIKGAVKHREEIVELKDVVLDDTERKTERDLFGVAIRKWEAGGSHWRLQVLFAVLADVMSQAQAAIGQVDPSGKSQSASLSQFRCIRTTR